jgi:hypothetical protein
VAATLIHSFAVFLIFLLRARLMASMVLAGTCGRGRAGGGRGAAAALLCGLCGPGASENHAASRLAQLSRRGRAVQQESMCLLMHACQCCMRGLGPPTTAPRDADAGAASPALRPAAVRSTPAASCVGQEGLCAPWQRLWP